MTDREQRIRNSRYKDSEQPVLHDVIIDKERIGQISDELLRELKRLGINKVLLECLPLYYEKSGKYKIQNWGSGDFLKGYKTIDEVVAGLKDGHAEVEVTALLDNTQGPKLSDESTWQNMKTRLDKLKQTRRVSSTLEELIYQRKAVLERQYGLQRSCHARDARYQLEKLVGSDGDLRNDRLCVIVHPSEFWDEQKKMSPALEAEMGVRFPELPVLQRRQYISAVIRNVWINNGEISKGITYPTFTPNGKGEFVLLGE